MTKRGGHPPPLQQESTSNLHQCYAYTAINPIILEWTMNDESALVPVEQKEVQLMRRTDVRVEGGRYLRAGSPFIDLLGVDWSSPQCHGMRRR